MAYQIITDGSCDLGEERARMAGIQVVPFYVTFDGKTYQKEIEEISVREFYQEMVDDPDKCKRLTGYVAKKEMLRYPILRDWMTRLHCLFLDRDNPKEGLKSILQAIDYVKSGISVCIFPEGTRNDGEELSILPFHSGSFKIAEKSGCAIIPISMNNTHTMFEKHIPRIEKTHVVIEYGKPIYPGDLDKETRKRIGSYCQSIIQETINRNQELV